MHKYIFELKVESKYQVDADTIKEYLTDDCLREPDDKVEVKLIKED